MSDSSFVLTNKQAREVWLNRQSLASSPCGKPQVTAFADRVARLGMVQLDSIGVLSRAHHHILWSRQSAYRQTSYDKLMQGERSVFEHFSHDAVILPMSTYPYWQRQQQRRASRYSGGAWGQAMRDRRLQSTLINHIEKHGPVCSRDLAEYQQGAVDKSNHAWMRPAHKLTLDYLWLRGTLSVSHRKNFTKYYDLTERIIPDRFRIQQLDEQTQINWLCEQALTRLGFASAIEIQRFWDACELSEVHAWLLQPSIPVMKIAYLDTQGNRINAYAPAELEQQILDDAKPVPRVRILSPFDPVVRDRVRLQNLFGFDYRIEIYVPAAKRRYGYYVYPMLEGNRMTGRIDVRANRSNDQLETRAWWLEPGIQETTARRAKIEQELARLAKLAGVSSAGPLPARSEHPAKR
ncbi:winged helix-turn-helix domain-containing protein [Granulosicoccus antarcticus]|nr:crosslink repair DNA glycosylase YcaQ family protein [Granulosicoccus antarcticus]